MMVRVMATSTQHPGQRAKNRHQRDDKAEPRKNVLAHTRARQAVRQRVEHRIVNTVTGKVVAGV